MKKMFSIPTENDIKSNINLSKNTKITDFAIFLSPLDEEYLTYDNISQEVNTSIFSKNIGPVRIKLDINEITQLPRQMIFVNGDNSIAIGEYPQSKVDEFTNKILNLKYDTKKLKKTPKERVVKVVIDKNNQYKTISIKEYYYNKEKYVFIEKNKEKTWFKVEPVIFKNYNGTWYSDKILFANIPLNFLPPKNHDFESSFLSEFLNTCFKVNILSTAVILLHDNEKRKLKDYEKELILYYYKDVAPKDLKKIRREIRKLGEDYLCMFDSIWIGGDINKAKKLLNLNKSK